MDVAIVVVLSGLSTGVVLFLISAGLSLVLGLMGIINIAHGALVMTGAYFGLMVAKWTGNFILASVAGAALAGIVGLVIERGFLRKIYRLQMEQILVTFGFVYVITNIHLWIYGAWPQSGFVPQSLSGSIPIGNFSFTIYRLVIIIIGLILCPLLWWLQERTRIGAIIRGGMDDPQMISILGINLQPVNVGAFFVGACLAGFAGFLGVPIWGGIQLGVGMDVIFPAIAVVIVGGAGSIQGTLVGSLLIGIATALAGTYFSIIAMFVPYILMVIILILKPAGLLGRK